MVDIDLFCGECGIGCDEVPLGVKGIIYTGEPKHIVISVLCKKCEMGEEGSNDIRKDLGENDGSKEEKS